MTTLEITACLLALIMILLAIRCIHDISGNRYRINRIMENLGVGFLPRVNTRPALETIDFKIKYHAAQERIQELEAENAKLKDQLIAYDKAVPTTTPPNGNHSPEFIKYMAKVESTPQPDYKPPTRYELDVRLKAIEDVMPLIIECNSYTGTHKVVVPKPDAKVDEAIRKAYEKMNSHKVSLEASIKGSDIDLSRK